MSKIRKLSVRVVALSSWVLFSAGIANAIQIGPVIKMDSHGHLTVEEHFSACADPAAEHPRAAHQD
jgi:hypothetical protein